MSESMDTLYVDRASGRFIAFTYSDGQKITLRSLKSEAQIVAYARRYNYQVVWID